MDPILAAAAMDAIARTGHPRLDYRTDEAKRFCGRYRPLLETLVTPGCCALDLGCAAGKCTFLLEELGAEVVGLDCSEGMIALAREVAEDIESRAEFVVGRFEQLPFEAESFDLVWFPSNIVECSRDEMDGIARQIATILRPGGRFALAMRDRVGAPTRVTSIQVSDGSEYPYEVTHWSVAGAEQVVGQHLKFVSSAPTGHAQLYGLIFAKRA